MKRRTQALILAIAALGFLASLAFSPVQPFDSETMTALDQTGATVENWSAENLELFTPSGDPVTLADFGGEIVYLTYWAEWCSVCKEEMPAIDAFARVSGNRVAVVMASIDDDPTASFDYLREQYPNGPHFRVLVDPGGHAATQFGTTGVPETFIIDGSGTVIARFIGPHNFTSPAHQRLLNHLLASR